ncbi:ElaB/YqjD/DUF883 family membrane-anchored ribosome-binding protein [Chitinivorax tropicus]|uniref:ElaB/YqjD/DUF883 family membrane-anchored ribosome-binding protein n=1 Tax=Chitinivorax tropicus TaxID=714531 RepID=A0A840MME8_9PROT|nr:DUF883 family protein [Chitinivorax tropicus]MBB5018299.1 ElaB/YqjD/DUF883 family membrane-anchored ribosome-binding protein [Chitinivorax tropicus]
MAGDTRLDNEALIDDLRDVLTDTEAMLKEVQSDTSEQAAAVREKVMANLRSAKTKLLEAERLVAEKTKAAAKATDEYVHEHPWQAVGIAAGVGFLLGLLVSRR